MALSIWNLVYKSRYKRSTLKTYIPYRHHRIVHNQLHEYNRVTSLLLDGNRQIFGTILYYFLLSNIPVNIFLLARGVFEDHRTIEEIISWVFMFSQLTIMFIVFSLLSWLTAVCHKPSTFIPVLQPMLKSNSNWLWYKIKYTDLYYRLVDNGPKIGVAFGDMHTVTYVSSFEILLAYIGYVLMAFNMKIEANLENLKKTTIYSGSGKNIILFISIDGIYAANSRRLPEPTEANKFV
ncbi:hypothetical protein BLOT_015842 [Blomia tropicalis]|nr:hypothetical protein BLOT_015842 [Blomia tropicalis]